MFSDFSSELACFMCTACGRMYKWKASLRNHIKNECGKEPQFKCRFCVYKTRQKGNFYRHLATIHNVTVNMGKF